jgi:hypothetical protein
VWKVFPKELGYLIELVLMNPQTPYDVLCSLFHKNWKSRKEDGKDYSFDIFCDLLIRDQQKLLDEGKLGDKHQDHLFKGKGKNIYNDRGHVNIFGP